MKAYVVNLARSTDRRVHMESQLSKTSLSFEFVEGIDGRDLDVHDPQVVDPALLGKSWFRPGVAGCTLGHLRVHNRLIEERQDKALVLEDDVLLPADIAPLLDSIAAEMSGADVVLLNFHTMDPCRLTREGSVRLPRSRLLVRPLDAGQLTSAGAYLITREACERIARFRPPVRARADDWGTLCELGAIDSVRCVVPIAVRKDSHFQSTIGYHDGRALRAKLQKIARYRLPVFFQLIALRRRLIEWRWSRVEFVPEPRGSQFSAASRKVH